MIKSHKRLVITIIAGLSLTGLFAIFLVLTRPSASSVSDIQPKLHSANPDDKDFFETAYHFADKNIDLSGKRVVAGIIPHHLLAADLIADFFHNLEGQNYDSIILLGPNHFLSGQSDIITSAYDWQTPYGILEHDDDTLHDLLFVSGLDVGVEESVVQGEHAISSEVAFIKKTFPQAKFTPLILKPGVNQQQAVELAETLFKISQDKKILVLVSADFSHYKTSQEAQRDDVRSIAAITNFDFSSIYDIDVDSPPSIYTLLKFSQLNGAGFELLDNSNSALLSGRADLTSTTSYVTGYVVWQDINLLFVGDIMLDRGVKTLIEQKGFEYILDDLVSNNFFADYDLVGANLEGAVTDGGQHYEPAKEFDFAFDPAVVARLSEYGFNFFNLANNHFNDQGQRGIAETKKNLAALGINFSGCPDATISACSLTVIPVKHKKIGLVGLNMAAGKIDSEKVREAISSATAETDWIIVNIHWGEEYDTAANKLQRQMAHELIDSGADVIIGHHPHVVQEVEVYKSKPIFYSLGNFIFDQYFSDFTQEGLAVSLNISKAGVEYTLHPFKAANGQLRLEAD
ncbi:MAG: AmmeMemoRadiSam system protein B [Candidatus Buchananbacteria bacterium]|nr:AmmeMemoRadiSam system protein B [Candidatus Buchananbacteria bacterium]